jgi:hypothetical protein
MTMPLWIYAIRGWAQDADRDARDTVRDRPNSVDARRARGRADAYAWWWVRAHQLAVASPDRIERMALVADDVAEADEAESGRGRRAATADVLDLAARQRTERGR